MGRTVESEPSFRSEEEFGQAEFCAWLERNSHQHLGKQELLHGRIVVSPPAGLRHAGIAARIVVGLGAAAATLRGFELLDGSAGFEPPSGDALQPDASLVDRERLRAAGPRDAKGFPRVVPSLVDPGKREIWVYSLADGRYGEADVVSAGRLRSVVVPDLVLTVHEVFAGTDG